MYPTIERDLFNFFQKNNRKFVFIV
jgi:hypothetical protein